MSQFDPVILMLRDRARAAIAGHADDALPVFEALLAALLAALAAPMPAAERPRTLATKAELMADHWFHLQEGILFRGLAEPRQMHA